MSQKIQLLSEETINQIAAGEVIENPASVVKELVENALDAEATQIEIEIKGGGLQAIYISDNGSGMGDADALLSLKRHATSKIREAKDLIEVGTLGFRGEALASIAAISKMTLLTALEGDQATQVEVEGGEINNIHPAPRNRGTTIEVRSLFHNVPARKKFQKSSAACAAEVTRVVTALALAYPEVGFKLVSQGREVFSLAAGQKLKERAERLIGKRFMDSVFELKCAEEGFSLVGLIGSPLEARQNRLGQHLFINNRPVVSSMVSWAVKDGYGTRIASQLHPAFVLHLELARPLVDANVHPQKREVRLREEQVLKGKIREAISDVYKGKEAPPSFVLRETPFAFERPTISFEPQTFSFRDSPQEPTLIEPEARAIGLFAHYLLLEAEKLVILDLKAAIARVHCDSLIVKADQKGEKQGLIFPLTLEVSASQAAMILTHLEAIEEMGFSLQAIDKQAFLINAIPPFLEEEEAKKAVVEMAEELQSFIGKSDIQEERRRHLARVVCGFARRRKRQFSMQEALQLFKELGSTTQMRFCPLGRPLFIHLSEDEIAKHFS